jgi:hypothetical protein
MHIKSLTRVAGLALALAAPLSLAHAQAPIVDRGQVTLAWDANDDGITVGYIVYIANAPGEYFDAYDVGDVTEWTYRNASARGERFYFAVAAYSADGLVGPLSEEVDTTLGEALHAAASTTQHHQLGRIASRASEEDRAPSFRSRLGAGRDVPDHGREH